MHAGTARHAGAFHTECMQRPPSEGPHAPCPRRAGGTAPSAHLAIQPIPCNKRQHLTELRTSPSLLLLRLRPALPRLRLLLALLPALGPCQRARPQAGLQEAGLSFKEQKAAAKKPPPSTPHLQPGCRSWATKTQPQGRRVEGGGRPEEAPGQNCREQPQAALGGGRPHSSFTNLPAPTARAAGQFCIPFCCKAGTRMQQAPENRTPTRQHGDSRRTRRGEPRRPSDSKQRRGRRTNFPPHVSKNILFTVSYTSTPVSGFLPLPETQ